jgi:glycosyltransferase involved in cell wall biosynthesis
MRVGFITTTPLGSARDLSGMPHAAACALAGVGLDLLPFEVGRTGEDRSAPRSPLRTLVRRAVGTGSALDLRRLGAALAEKGSWPIDHRLLRRTAEQRADRLRALLDQNAVDLLFGVCVSTPLLDLETEVPIVYFSDATARLINTTYERFARKSSRYHRESDRIERDALSRVAAAAFPTRMAMASAIRDHGLPADRAHLVPLGAHVTPEPGTALDPEPPSPQNLELLVVAIDPVRKRVDFCVEIAEQLAARGHRTTLHQIGMPTRRSARSPLVHQHGFLDLGNPDDRRLQLELFRRSHLLLLPSTGEMFGIAPCEAAHFGRPSVVSDAGGLPEVVLDGETGIVMPLAASASGYADAIAALCADPQRYRRMSARALERAQTVLNWHSWALRMREIFEQVLDGRRAGLREHDPLTPV